jgi:hypothetical protein
MKLNIEISDNAGQFLCEAKVESGFSWKNFFDRVVIPALTGKKEQNAAPQTKSVAVKDKRAGQRTQAFIALYCEAFKITYKVNPAISKADAGRAKRLAFDIPENKHELYLGAYLAMRDPFFVAKRHNLATLESNLNAVKIFAEAGNTITRGQINEIDKVDTIKAKLARLSKNYEYVEIKPFIPSLGTKE